MILFSPFVTLVNDNIRRRAINNGLLDTYQLKSLDGVLEAPVEEMVLSRDGDKIHLGIKDEDDPESDYDNFALRENYDRVIRCLGFSFDNGIFTK